MENIEHTCSFFHDTYDFYERVLDSLVFQFNTVVCLGILRPNLALEFAMKNLNQAREHLHFVANQMEHLIHVARLLSTPEEHYTMAFPEEEDEELRARFEKTVTQHHLFTKLRQEYRHYVDETGPAVRRAEYKAALYHRRNARLLTRTTINTSGSEETAAELLAGLKIVYRDCENAIASQVEKHHTAVHRGIVETDSALRVATSNISFVYDYLQSVKAVGWHFVLIAPLMTLFDPTPAQPETVILVAADMAEEEHNPAAPAPARARAPEDSGAQSGSA